MSVFPTAASVVGPAPVVGAAASATASGAGAGAAAAVASSAVFDNASGGDGGMS